jgi:hypothetical protein
MSQEHDKTSAGTHVSTDIHPESAPFEPGYQPETLPKISVPDLADDAEGLSAEALANVPTLTELVEQELESAPVVTAVQEPAQMPAPTDDLPLEALPLLEDEAKNLNQPEAIAQAESPQADTWGEQLQVRMGKLTGDIDSLNARLDRLEERNKKKV